MQVSASVKNTLCTTVLAESMSEDAKNQVGIRIWEKEIQIS